MRGCVKLFQTISTVKQIIQNNNLCLRRSVVSGSRRLPKVEGDGSLLMSSDSRNFAESTRFNDFFG